MAINKETRTIQGVIHHLFKVQEDAPSRKFSIGSSWTRIRVGCRFALAEDPGNGFEEGPWAASPVPSKIAFGLQKSTGPTYAAFTKTNGHYIVLNSLRSAAVRAAGPPVTLSSASSNQTGIAAQHDSTIDSQTFASSVNNLRTCGDPNYLQAMILDVSRGTADWTAVGVYPTSTTPSHCTAEQLEAAIQAADSTTMLAALPAGYVALSATLSGMTARIALYGDLDELVFYSGVAHEGVIVTNFIAYRMA